MIIKIPNEFRQGGRLRLCDSGLDLPASFLDNVRAIDKHIYPVFHPIRVIWDNLINQYTGYLDDPRFTIGSPPGFSEEIWGFPLTNSKKEPITEGKWHLWRLCHSAGGWAHIVKLESTDGDYLQLFLNRLYLQAQYRDRYGNKAWNAKMQKDQESKIEADRNDNEQKFADIQKENRGLIKVAMENYEMGRIAPTNQTTEIIRSYAGQKNHTKIVRPMTDKEGGLFTPED